MSVALLPLLLCNYCFIPGPQYTIRETLWLIYPDLSSLFIPSVRCLPDKTLPGSVENSYRKGYWTEYMGRVMNYIGESLSCCLFLFYYFLKSALNIF